MVACNHEETEAFMKLDTQCPDATTVAPSLTAPDTAVLKEISYPSQMGIQPDWIVQRFPEYAADHGMEHELSSVRTAQHNGHDIKITTTYQIEIDGRNVHLHALVANNGQLFCHTTPYVEYTSAIELVKALLDKFPDAFRGMGDRPHHDDSTHHHHHA